METTVSPSASLLQNQLDASNFDELSMDQSLLFSDSLKELKNLRSQLYSAAEYFELSYATDDHKQFVVNTLREYAIKAVVNTVDHLGSVSFKVTGLLEAKVDEVSGAESRVSCIEQRIRACRELVDREGLSQQSLVIKAPRYHKRYIVPVGKSMPESGRHATPKYEKNLNASKDNTETHKFQPVHHPTVADKAPSFRYKRHVLANQQNRFQIVMSRAFDDTRKARTMSPAPSSRARSVSPRRIPSSSPSQLPGKLFGAEKRATSPIRMPNPLARSGSLAVRPTALRSTSSIGRQYSSATQKSASMRLHAERNDDKDGEQNPSKGKKFLKSLLSRRKSKKDEMVYSYLDEY
uniref:Protein ABIL2 n=2 Tax=Musa acuminata subsp. malaccensis TaxID=214687 RepID=A0A804HXG7_MUSAM